MTEVSNVLTYVVPGDFSARHEGLTVIVSNAQVSDVRVARDVYELLLQFIEPRTAADVYSEYESDEPITEFEQMLQSFVDDGLLSSGPAEDLPLTAILSDRVRDLFTSPSSHAAIQKHLKDKRALVLPGAFNDDVANEMYESLASYRGWVIMDGDAGRFQYTHNHASTDRPLPAALLKYRKYFASESTKRLIGGLADCDCSGRVDFGGSRYLAGDFTYPHSDSGPQRSVAYIWYLAKDWDPAWNGAFYWCQSGVQIMPSFNCLAMFRVSRETQHLVTQVSPYATSKRLSVNGWWYAKKTGAAAKASAQASSQTGSHLITQASYGNEPVELNGALIL